MKDEREVPRNPGFGKSLGNCLKFSQSKCRLHISNSQSEAGKFCAQSMRELLLVGNWNPARISKRGLSKTSKVSPVDIEIKGTGSSVSSSDIVIWCKKKFDLPKLRNRFSKSQQVLGQIEALDEKNAVTTLENWKWLTGVHFCV